MIRRPKTDAAAPLSYLEDPDFPPFDDPLNRPTPVRKAAWDEWMDTYWYPWMRARAEYEERNNVVFLDEMHMPGMPFDGSEV